MKMFRGLFGRRAALQTEGAQGGRRRLALASAPSHIYAIGDVHGCLDLLRKIEAMIAQDAERLSGDKLIVMLGDYVDRGAHSAQVLDHLLDAPPAGFQRICLLGNHEATMLGFLGDPMAYPEWLDYGGIETLASYGIDPDALARLGSNTRRLKQVLDSHVPDEHREFLQSLPIMLQTPLQVFVHAGLRAGVAIEGQEDSDLIWIRDDYRNDFVEFGRTVVHGHTPIVAPLVAPNRIGIDTGAFMTGRLSAVRLSAGEEPLLFSTASR